MTTYADISAGLKEIKQMLLGMQQRNKKFWDEQVVQIRSLGHTFNQGAAELSRLHTLVSEQTEVMENPDSVETPHDKANGDNSEKSVRKEVVDEVAKVVAESAALVMAVFKEILCWNYTWLIMCIVFNRPLPLPPEIAFGLMNINLGVPFSSMLDKPPPLPPEMVPIFYVVEILDKLKVLHTDNIDSMHVDQVYTMILNQVMIAGNTLFFSNGICELSSSMSLEHYVSVRCKRSWARWIKEQKSHSLAASHYSGKPIEDFGIKYSMTNGGSPPKLSTAETFEITELRDKYSIVEDVQVPNEIHRSLTWPIFEFHYDAIGDIAGVHANHIFVQELGAKESFTWKKDGVGQSCIRLQDEGWDFCEVVNKVGTKSLGWILGADYLLLGKTKMIDDVSNTTIAKGTIGYLILEDDYLSLREGHFTIFSSPRPPEFVVFDQTLRTRFSKGGSNGRERI